MLRSASHLKDYVLHAKDGEIGRCKDFLFDDEYWTVRYMVADTGKWLPKRRVIISPVTLGDPDWQSKRLPVELTKRQIEDGPHLDADAPVSRQREIEYSRYFGWAYYWTGIGVWGMHARPKLLAEEQKRSAESADEEEIVDSHLRSTEEVIGYHIQATDGEIGHVEDFIIDDDTWTIRYLVIDTRNWLPGRKVLIPPSWSVKIDWGQRLVSIDLTQGQIERSPEYDPSIPVNREYEARLYDFYGRPLYWS